MAPEDRRAALVDATVPLLHEHGLDVSTRQIACAAGVAEGTIFGVFKDKNSLLLAALAKGLDWQPTVDALAAIDPAADLRTRMIEAATVVHRRFSDSIRLLSAARSLAFSTGHQRDGAAQIARSREELHAAVTTLIEPDAARLRRSPSATAQLLLTFTGSATFGPYADPDGFDPAQTVSLLLDGLLTELPSGLVVPSFGGGAGSC